MLNGTTVAGLASSTVSELQQRGFNVVGTGNAATTDFIQNVIQYASPNDLPAAEALTAVISNVKTELVPRLQPGTVNLVLGSDFKALKPPRPPSNLAKAYNGITGNVNICKDAGAFAGPDRPSDFAP